MQALVVITPGGALRHRLHAGVRLCALIEGLALVVPIDSTWYCVDVDEREPMLPTPAKSTSDRLMEAFT